MKKLTEAALIVLLGLAGNAYAQPATQTSSADASSVDLFDIVTTPAGRKALGPQVAALRPDDNAGNGSSGSSGGNGAAGPGTIIAIPGHAYDAIRDSVEETPAGELVGPAPDAQALGVVPDTNR